MSAGGALSAAGTRVLAPLGKRHCEVTDSRASGGYRVFTVADEGGPVPAPGQFYMLRSSSWGSRSGRPHLPRAFSFARCTPLKDGLALEFLVEAVGPGTAILAGLEAGEPIELTGPLGRGFSSPQHLNPGAAGSILVGGGIGVAPLAAWRASLGSRGLPTRVLLGFRDEAHSGGIDLFGSCGEVRLASDDGHRGHRGLVTDLLAVLLEGEDAARSAAVYSCGPPPMLEAVRRMCAEREVVCELALESSMACGFGACFGCAVPLQGGGYMRLCVDGPVVRGDEIATALVPGAGH